MNVETPSTPASAPVRRAVIVGECSTPLWHVPPVERLRRGLVRVGIADAGVWVPGTAAASAADGTVLVVRADVAFDQAVLQLLAKGAPIAMVETGSSRPAALVVPAADVARAAAALAAGDVAGLGLPTAAPADAGAYRGSLRKREAPTALAITPEARPALERKLYAASYKGVTDLVTKYVWPEPAYWATRLCARLGITPNAVTLASLGFVIAAFLAFMNGAFAVGLVAAWAMTFLDTVDGKLARVTVTSSPWGNVFDHGIDLVHPPFWYWAWMMGLGAVGLMPEGAEWMLGVIVAGYVLQRLEEGLFIGAFGIEMHVWERFDSRFRLITARRNPNLLILTVATMLGRPDFGFAAVAWWTAICFVIHLVRIGQAALARRSGPIRSWLDA